MLNEHRIIKTYGRVLCMETTAILTGVGYGTVQKILSTRKRRRPGRPARPDREGDQLRRHYAGR